MIRSGPMTRLLAGRALRILLGLLALIEAIFLAEAFTTLMENVVRNGGSAFDLMGLLLLESPAIVDFALPISLLIGLFFAITAARDQNELIVCAAAGVPWTRIPAFATITGLVAMLVSLLFAGVVTPLASYGQRLALYQLEARTVIRQITDPGINSGYQVLRGRTFIASPRQGVDAERGNLFIYHPDEGLGWRVSQAEDWSVEGPDVNDDYSVRLKSFRDYTADLALDRPGQSATASAALGSPMQIATVTVKSLRMDFRLEQVIKGIDTFRRKRELTLFEIGAGRMVGDKYRIDRHFGEVLGRAMLCLFAALGAVAAAAWSGTRIGRFAALPVATVAVLLGDIVVRTTLGDAARGGPLVFLSTSGLTAIMAILLPLIYVVKRGELIIAPRRDE